MRNRWIRYTSLLAVVAACLSTSGCDNTVDPFTGNRSQTFAIFGYLDSEADTQFVHVSPVFTAAEADSPESVALIDEESDERFVWEPFSTGRPSSVDRYVYFSVFRPVPGRTYRLEVAHPGGELTIARTSLPGEAQVDIREVVETIAGGFEQTVWWRDVSSVLNVVVAYYLVDLPSGRRDTVRLDYPSPGTGFNPDDRTVIDLTTDRVTVATALGDPDSTRIGLAGLGISADLLGPEWGTPEPATRQIFFPSTARVEVAWQLPDSVITRLGYQIP